MTKPKKSDLERTMNELGKPFENPIKIEKTKHLCQNNAREQKPCSQKANFRSNTIFSL